MLRGAVSNKFNKYSQALARSPRLQDCSTAALQAQPKQLDQSLQLKRAGVVMLFRHCNIQSALGRPSKSAVPCTLHSSPS